jgi:hypothetical protein
MSEVVLELKGDILPVDRLLFSQVSDLFASSTAPLRYAVKSQVSLSVLKTFIDGIHGKPLEITTATFAPLSALSKEFGCRFSEEQLSNFEKSAEYGISCLTARLSRLEGEVAKLAARCDRELEHLHADVSVVKGDVFDELRAEIWALKAPRHGFSSLIVPEFLAPLAEFRGKRFTLLWRGSRDGFRARDFHRRCDGRANTLMFIEDTEGTIFGGFTAGRGCLKGGLAIMSDSGGATAREWQFCPLNSFLFGLKNPQNCPGWGCVPNAKGQHEAFRCYCSWSPELSDDCKAKTNRIKFQGLVVAQGDALYVRPLEPRMFCGQKVFKAKGIEVFEITD